MVSSDTLLLDSENVVTPIVINRASRHSVHEYLVPFKSVPINITGMTFVDLKMV